MKPARLTAIYALSGGKCVVASYPAHAAYALGSEIPASSFVQGAIQASPSANSFQERLLVGSDGSRALESFSDLSGGFDCRFATAADGQLRCVPLSHTNIWETVFTDASCASAAAGCDSRCTPSRFALKYDVGTDCSTRHRAFLVGAPASSLFASTSRGCQSSASSPAFSMFAADGELTPSRMQLSPATAEPSTGRIRIILRSLPNGLPWASEFRDSSLNTTVAPTLASDGAWRFLPSFTASTGTYFADAACTVPLAYSAWQCTPRFAHQYDGCPQRARVYRVGAPHKGFVYLRAASGSCISTTSTLTFFQATEVAPAEFEPAVLSLQDVP